MPNNSTPLSDESDQRYFLNPESVSSHLYCSICQEVFNNPQRAPCGHSFCKQCIHAWLKQSRTCPEDRKPLLAKDLHHDFIVENIIGDQMVACKFRRKGCSHICQLSSYASHLRNCGFNPENLPDFLQTDANSDANQSIANISCTDDENTVPTPAKPSLKMRLFQAGGTQRDLLCSAFSSQPSSAETDRRPLKLTNDDCVIAKRRRIS